MFSGGSVKRERRRRRDGVGNRIYANSDSVVKEGLGGGGKWGHILDEKKDVEEELRVRSE